MTETYRPESFQTLRKLGLETEMQADDLIEVMQNLGLEFVWVEEDDGPRIFAGFIPIEYNPEDESYQLELPSDEEISLYNGKLQITSEYLKRIGYNAPDDNEEIEFKLKNNLKRNLALMALFFSIVAGGIRMLSQDPHVQTFMTVASRLSERDIPASVIDNKGESYGEVCELDAVLNPHPVNTYDPSKETITSVSSEDSDVVPQFLYREEMRVSSNGVEETREVNFWGTEGFGSKDRFSILLLDTVEDKAPELFQDLIRDLKRMGIEDMISLGYTTDIKAQEIGLNSATIRRDEDGTKLFYDSEEGQKVFDSLESVVPADSVMIVVPDGGTLYSRGRDLESTAIGRAYPNVMWVAGSSEHTRYIAIHEILHAFGPNRGLDDIYLQVLNLSAILQNNTLVLGDDPNLHHDEITRETLRELIVDGHEIQLLEIATCYGVPVHMFTVDGHEPQNRYPANIMTNISYEGYDMTEFQRRLYRNIINFQRSVSE